MNSLERKRQLLIFVQSEDNLSVLELTERFNVSTVNILNDLRSLEVEALLVRAHGGPYSAFHSRRNANGIPVNASEISVLD